MKRFFSVFLACSLVFFQAIPSFAFTATPSEVSSVVATPSNALYDIQPLDYSDNGLWIVDNTVDMDYVTLNVAYYDMSNNVKYSSVQFDSSQHAVLPLPDDCASIQNVFIRLASGALPSPGTYEFWLRFNSDVGVTYESTAYIQASKSNHNAMSQNNSQAVQVTQVSGDFTVNETVEIGNVANLQLVLYPDNISPTFLPWGGYVHISFEKTDDEPAYTTPGGLPTSGDIQENISNSVSSINNQMESIDGTLKEIVQTISYQLEAFWNQLAGEFTNLYNKMNQQHEELLNALEEGLEVTIINQFDELIANDNKNHQEQLANDDKNTEEITNGYDNSSITADNDRLNTALEDNEQLENEALGEAAGHLEDFEFTNPITQYLSTFILFGDFLQDLFTNSGAFFNVINLSFILSIALIVIGLYRFKGGS